MPATRSAFAAAAMISTAFAAGGAIAAPKVVADIPAVHSIAAAVMDGLGEPALAMAPGASPHGYAMRPSEAQALASADLIFWIGPELTPWLGRAIDALGDDARAVPLIRQPGIRLLEVRGGATFEAHEHDHGDEETQSDDGHAKDDEHGHEHDHDHDHDHQGAHEDHDDHGHKSQGAARAVDPHIWLDPRNGAAMADAIAEALSEADPANAASYEANAAALKAEIAAVERDVAAAMKALAERPYVVFHDAYQYFEVAFGIEAAGAVSLSDAAAPGPARIEEIRALITEIGAVCVFSEPQYDARLAARLVENTDVRRGELDPLGATLAIGGGLYAALLADLGAEVERCLTADRT